MRRLAFYFLILLSLAGTPLGAAVSPAEFDGANRLYEEGKFAEAVAAYEKLTQSGQASAALWFNLGNGYFKSHQIGRAIAAYRKAEELTPRDPDVRANLQFARNQAQGPTLAPNRWQRWLAKLSLNEWTLLTAGCLWMLLLLLALAQWRPSLKSPLRRLGLALMLGTGVLSSCLGAAWRQNHALRAAVVVVPDAVVRHGPLDESQTAFTAHDGAELLILDQKEDWVQVAAGPRQVGWLRQGQVLELHRSK